MRRPSFWFLAFLLAAVPVLADAAGTEPAAPTERCQTLPDEKNPQPQDNSAGNTPSTTLGDCHGVLKPPDTGDNGMTEPAPDVGKTPLVRPGDLPGQQNTK